MKIAPTLTMLIARYWARTGPGSRPAKRELDALLAVVREAKQLHTDMALPDDARLGLALARLERVSGRKP